jgi:hypothetical protein
MQLIIGRLHIVRYKSCQEKPMEFVIIFNFSL